LDRRWHSRETNGSGSTFVFPILAKWASQYQAKTGDKINYQSIGSGAGLQQVKAGTVDFGASDMPLRPDDLAKTGLGQFPLVIGGVVPVVIPLKGPNDIVFYATGGFWFTDLGKTYGRLMDRGAVYYARSDGSLVKEAIYPILTSNGVGLSPDGRTLYVSETETSRVWRCAITGEGEVEKMPWPSPNGGKFLHGLPGYQRFDSLAVEADGNVCVATLVRGGISVFSPGGDLVEFHEAPEVYCTNMAGSQDRRFLSAGLKNSLYITLSPPACPRLYSPGELIGS
jgi:hypothetical protein